MSIIYISEYDQLASQEYGPPVPVGLEPAIATQVKDYSGGVVQSDTFNANTRFVMVHTDAACHVKFGAGPTATTSNQRLPADATIFFGVDPTKSLKISAIGA